MNLSLTGGRYLDPSLSMVEGDLHVGDDTIAREAPPGARAVDVSGLTLLPGFIDTHVHIGFFDPREVLAGGVTTVRDLAWPEDEIFSLARESRDPTFAGPDIHAVGPMLTVEGGYPLKAAWAPSGTGEIVGAKDADMVVERLVRRGAIAIKVGLNAAVGPTFDADTLRAIVEAAHQRSLKVTAHVTGLSELEKALEAGIDEMAHMLMSAETIPDATIARMVETGIVVVPTLSCRFGQDLEIAIDNLARFLDAGGKVVYGTDLGNEGPKPGIDEREIEMMSRAGMSVRDIIVSATSDAAEWLGLSDRGSLAPEKRADIIGVNGDPSDDVDCLTDVALVVRAGRLFKEP